MIGTKAQETQSVATLQRGPRKIRLMIAGAVLVIAAGAGVGTYEATASSSASARTTTVQTGSRLSAFEQLKQETYRDPSSSQRLNAFKGLKNGQ